MFLGYSKQFPWVPILHCEQGNVVLDHLIGLVFHIWRRKIYIAYKGNIFADEKLLYKGIKTKGLKSITCIGHQDKLMLKYKKYLLIVLEQDKQFTITDPIDGIFCQNKIGETVTVCVFKNGNINFYKSTELVESHVLPNYYRYLRISELHRNIIIYHGNDNQLYYYNIETKRVIDSYEIKIKGHFITDGMYYFTRKYFMKIDKKYIRPLNKSSYLIESKNGQMKMITTDECSYLVSDARLCAVSGDLITVFHSSSH